MRLRCGSAHVQFLFWAGRMWGCLHSGGLLRAARSWRRHLLIGISPVLAYSLLCVRSLVHMPCAAAILRCMWVSGLEGPYLWYGVWSLQVCVSEHFLHSWVYADRNPSVPESSAQQLRSSRKRAAELSQLSARPVGSHPHAIVCGEGSKSGLTMCVCSGRALCGLLGGG